MDQTVKQRRRVFLKSELVILVCLLCIWIVTSTDDPHSTKAAGAALNLVAKISACEAAIRIDPNDHEAYRDLAWAYHELWRPDKTKEFATKALNLDPNDADAHYLLGISRWMLDRDEEVESNLKEAIRLDPKHFDAQATLAIYYRRSGRYEESIEAAKHAISIRPDDVREHFSLGDDYFALGKYEEAIEAYEQAIKLDVDDAPTCSTQGYVEAYLNLGNAYRNTNRPEEAIECYKAAIEFDPNCFAAHYFLAQAYLQMGNRELAVEEYEIVKTSDRELAEKLRELIGQAGQ